MLEEEKILTVEEIKRIMEAVLFAAGHPVTFSKLAEVIGISEEKVRAIARENVEAIRASNRRDFRF